MDKTAITRLTKWSALIAAGAFVAVACRPEDPTPAPIEEPTPTTVPVEATLEPTPEPTPTPAALTTPVISTETAALLERVPTLGCEPAEADTEADPGDVLGSAACEPTDEAVEQVTLQAFEDTDVWKPLGLSFGLATMVWARSEAVSRARHARPAR